MSARNMMRNHLPWANFVAPSVVSTWSGDFCRTYQFRGPDIASATHGERVKISERIGDVFRRRGDGRWTWHVESQNLEVRGYPQREWPTLASRLQDAEREAMLARSGTQYEMRHWITFTQRPPSVIGDKLQNVLVTGVTEESWTRNLDEFQRSCDDVVKQLRSVVHVDEIDDDDIATYYHSTCSTKRHRVCAADHEILSETLSDEPFRRGIGLSSLGDNFLAVLTLGGFPKKSRPQMLADLAKLPFEFRHVVRCVMLDRAKAKKLMSERAEKARGNSESAKGAVYAHLQRYSSNPVQDTWRAPTDREEEALSNEAERAMERLSERGYVDMTTTFVVWDKDKRRCLQKRSDIQTVLELAGLVVRRESLESVKPWRMSLPGNREEGPRTFAVNTRNVADLMQVASVWTGQPFDKAIAKATGVSAPWMYTADPTPLRINTDRPGGAAHMLVLGATGQAGKSSFANQMAQGFLWVPGARVVSISVGRSELGPVLLNGGSVFRIGDARSPLRFQPLAFIDEPNGRRAASEWLQTCFVEQGYTPTSEDVEKLGEALDLRAGDKVHRRTLTDLHTDLSSRAPHLAAALRDYTSAGDYGHIFDGNDPNVVRPTRWSMFDISALIGMSRKALVPAISHMLAMIERWIDGTPILVIGDECPRWLPFEPLTNAAIKMLDVDRKNHLRLMLLAQAPGQLLTNKRLLASIKSGCAARFYGPDSEAMQSAAEYEEFGVSPIELETIAKLPLGSWMLKSPYGTRAFDLRSGDVALAMCGLSSPEELALLERLHVECEGDSDKMLMALMRERGLEKRAVELLEWKTAKSAKTTAAA